MYYNVHAIGTYVLLRVWVKYFKGLDFSYFLEKLGGKKEKLSAVRTDTGPL